MTTCLKWHVLNTVIEGYSWLLFNLWSTENYTDFVFN